MASTSLLGAMLFVASACGPGIAGDDGAGTGGETTGSSLSTMGPGESTAVSAAETGASSSSSDTGSTGEPFVCELGEELVPGYCFERIDFELPGPLVMQRAVGADIDGDGVDELTVEVELDGTKTLTVWEIEPEIGPVLIQEVQGWPDDFEHTTLFGGDRNGDGLEDVLRTVFGGVEMCTADPDTFLLDCHTAPAVADTLHPATAAHVIGLGDALQIVSVPADSDLGFQIYSVATASVGHPHDPQSTPPCEDLIAVAVGDVDGNGEPDVLHRSDPSCVGGDDPRRDDVYLCLGNGTNIQSEGPEVSVGIEARLLLVADFDADGIDELLAADPDDPDGYRLVGWEGDGWGTPVDAVGPPGVERLLAADLRGYKTRDVIFVGTPSHISPDPLASAHMLPPELGRVLAVVNADGDALDDLLMEGPAPDQFLVLLLSR